jgi:hypothetical protein
VESQFRAAKRRCAGSLTLATVQVYVA